MTPTERLLLLADKLEQNANNPTGMKFDLNDWFGDETINKIETDLAINCGTVGCAVGLAMLTPEFNAEGFRYSQDFDPMYQDSLGWNAVHHYFGLSNFESSNLFSDSSYSIKKGAEAELLVAAKIREFVKSGESP